MIIWIYHTCTYETLCQIGPVKLMILEQITQLCKRYGSQYLNDRNHVLVNIVIFGEKICIERLHTVAPVNVAHFIVLAARSHLSVAYYDFLRNSKDIIYIRYHIYHICDIMYLQV